ncbi:MAG: hypothetical protein GWM92_22035, partial [Gemmatimonadetes bacterium]|nr:hypothetical protein [Gemmatimonadota bacterium]NIR81539.1 hypothetical protein [Gemmatimonadota bacterium]NIT90380.1 hypothetical protein [Gemmatimonadota bacterium]NIU34208.1 hypothetical protein [Gemmatimonadota bacterium]NIU38355.1 hypothetical protein [Gemmatimonadota bacterium]
FADALPPGVGDLLVEPWVPRELRGRSGRVILRYTLTGPRAPEALRARVDSAVIPALSRVTGVAMVRPLGGVGRVL